MFVEHCKLYVLEESNVVMNENSGELKPYINRESNSLELTIKLYRCYDEHESSSSCNITVYLSDVIVTHITRIKGVN